MCITCMSMYGYDLPCGWWEPSPGPIPEQQVLLIARAFLHPHKVSIITECRIFIILASDGNFKTYHPYFLYLHM